MAPKKTETEALTATIITNGRRYGWQIVDGDGNRVAFGVPRFPGEERARANYALINPEGPELDAEVVEA